MKKRFLNIHPNVLLLGIVSFLTDLSSEMIFSVFSIFFTIILGASSALLGLIEGLADFSASSLDYLSGYLSDKTGRRKQLTIMGYGFSTLAKSILLFTNTVFFVGAFRVIERLGKSFRGPPRDAWIAAIADKQKRGYAFGVHKTLDKSGAILGPLVAYALLALLGESLDAFKILFFVALIPAILAVVILCLIKDGRDKQQKRENIFHAMTTLSPNFKKYLVAAALFSLAYFSFGFLLLRAYQLGFSVKEVVLLYALFNIAYVFIAIPIGKLGDHIGRQKIILLGYGTYLVMCLGFVFATTKTQIIALFVLFGIFYAIDDSQSKAFISDLETKRRATAMGAYNFITGLMYFPASLIAGALWLISPALSFSVAIGFSACAMLSLHFLSPSSLSRR